MNGVRRDSANNSAAYEIVFQFAPLDYVYARGDFSGFVNVSGFINSGVFGFVGVHTERIFGFLTVYTQRELRKHS